MFLVMEEGSANGPAGEGTGKNRRFAKLSNIGRRHPPRMFPKRGGRWRVLDSEDGGGKIQYCCQALPARPAYGRQGKIRKRGGQA